ncbi:uncharacterized protein TNCV_3411761 [Trichonephila clavipes]|nr:uncharacterized protein TNCV_3411761 [Trichonephila clavipes]
MHLDVVSWETVIVISRVRKRNEFQHISDFDKGRIAAYRICCLSYHSIAARVGLYPMTVSRICNRWVQNGNIESRAESQRPPVTSSQEHRHVTRMDLMDREAMSRALSQELGLCLQHQDDRICVRCIGVDAHWQRPFFIIILAFHLLGAIGYTSWSPLVRDDDTLNSARYISAVLRPFIRVLRNPTFKQDNARLHVAGIVRTFLDTKNVLLLSWLVRTPDPSPIENVCSMFVLVWYWYALVYAIQSLFYSMPRRISAVFTARGGWWWTIS